MLAMILAISSNCSTGLSIRTLGRLSRKYPAISTWIRISDPKTRAAIWPLIRLKLNSATTSAARLMLTPPPA
ncbi:hypothetical protein ACVMHZ_006314 [Bradyrhizobium liaoningense]